MWSSFDEWWIVFGVLFLLFALSVRSRQEADLRDDPPIRRPVCIGCAIVTGVILVVCLVVKVL